MKVNQLVIVKVRDEDVFGIPRNVNHLTIVYIQFKDILESVPQAQIHTKQRVY